MVEELWRKYNKNNSKEARDELIMACLSYVKSCAYRLAIYANPSQDVNDLINAGIIGLMDAVDRYDPAKGASFKNYASIRVRGSIMDEIRSMDWVPYSTREKARKIEKAMQQLEQNGNSDPTDVDLAEAIGISLEKYHEILLEVSRMTLTLIEDAFQDGEVINDSDGKFSDDPESKLMHSEMMNAVGDAIERLPEKERLVITLYYYEEMTMKEIGETISVSESRVCQIHSSATLRLHARLKYANVDVGV